MKDKSLTLYHKVYQLKNWKIYYACNSVRPIVFLDNKKQIIGDL